MSTNFDVRLLPAESSGGAARRLTPPELRQAVTALELVAAGAGGEIAAGSRNPPADHRPRTNPTIRKNTEILKIVAASDRIVIAHALDDQ